MSTKNNYQKDILESRAFVEDTLMIPTGLSNMDARSKWPPRANYDIFGASLHERSYPEPGEWRGLKPVSACFISRPSPAHPASTRS